MLSVIVPIYNVEKYLSQCVESIINQTYKNLEIILVNDGSTDLCSEICDKFSILDSRIKVFHKSNEGLVRARKFGLEKATGEYITFVDGDDWIEPNMYLNLIDAMKQTNADFVDSGHFYDKEGFSNIERQIENNIFILDEVTKHKFFLALLGLDCSININQNIWCKVFKSNIIKGSYAKVPDSMQYGEDVINILYCILKSKKMIQVNNVSYHYRYRNRSLSHSEPNSLIRKEVLLWSYCGDVILHNDNFITQNDIDNSLVRRMYVLFESIMMREFDVIQYFSFPYIETLFNKRVAIYGAGRVGKDYITQISKYEKCEIVSWVDEKYKDYDFKYRQVVSIECLVKQTYDIILIAVMDKKIADNIQYQLIKKGVSQNKIIWHKPNTLF